MRGTTPRGQRIPHQQTIAHGFGTLATNLGTTHATNKAKTPHGFRTHAKNQGRPTIKAPNAAATGCT